MAARRRRYSKETATQIAALAILIAVAVGVIDLLFLSKSKVAKFVRPFAWTVLLAAGLWCLRERTRPEFYQCEACGLEYTCEDGEGREPHGYCEKTVSHKHRGSVVERYDFARGAKGVLNWTLGGLESAGKVFGLGGKDGEKPVGTEQQQVQGG